MIQFPLRTILYKNLLSFTQKTRQLLLFHRVLLAPIRKRFPSFVSFSTVWEYALPEPDILGEKMDITSSVSVAGPYVTTESDALVVDVAESPTPPSNRLKDLPSRDPFPQLRLLSRALFCHRWSNRFCWSRWCPKGVVLLPFLTFWLRAARVSVY